MSDTEQRFDVVWPSAPLHETGEQSAENGGTTRAFRDAGLRLGFVWDYVFNGDEMFEAIKSAFAAEQVDVEFVDYEAFGNIHSHDEDEVVAQRPDAFRRERVDAVVVGVGA
jgi:hypothetical protein